MFQCPNIIFHLIYGHTSWTAFEWQCSTSSMSNRSLCAILCTFHRGVKEFPASMVCHKLWDCTRVHKVQMFPAGKSSIPREAWLKLRWLGQLSGMPTGPFTKQHSWCQSCLANLCSRSEPKLIASKNQRSDAAPRSPNSEKATHANPLSMSVVTRLEAG